MKKEDIKIGMKVVPFQKTTKCYGGLSTSNSWKTAQEKGQNFLFVVDNDVINNYFVLNQSGIGKSGDFFNAEDFEPYNNKKTKEIKNMNDDIKQVIYNQPATIVQWTDGTKTIVKTSENDEYDPVFGVLMAYFQKQSGLSKTQVGKFCDKVVEDFNEQQEKKSKKNSSKLVTYKVIFYNTNEEQLLEKEYESNNIDCLFDSIVEEFGCDNNKPYETINNTIYGYIHTFDCYGRFGLTQIK